MVRATAVYGTDGETVEAYRMDVYSNENAVIRNAAGTLDTSTPPWGVFPNESGSSGFPATLYNEIASQSGLGSITSVPINDKSNTDGDTEGDNIIIMNIANKIIEGWLATMWANTDLGDYEGNDAYTTNVRTLLEWAERKAGQTPATMWELADMMLAVMYKMSLDGATTPSRYYQLFFPATYSCHLYQPTVNNGDVLNEQYARGNWKLPAIGLLRQIYQFYHASRNKTNGGTPSASYANEDESLTNENYPLFSNLLKRLADDGMTSDLNMPTNSSYWSCTEGISTGAWGVYFYSGGVGVTSKCNTGIVVRPVAAFTFEL